MRRRGFFAPLDPESNKPLSQREIVVFGLAAGMMAFAGVLWLIFH
jgi:hypothetical protein